MSVDFQRYTGEQAREIRATVEDVYRRAYFEAIAAGDPFNTPEPFMERFDSYTRADGFELVQASVGGEPAGQTWGWPLTARSRWWEGLELDEADLNFTTEDGSRTFALSEIMVAAEFTGRHIARGLHDELLGGRPEKRATLLVDEPNRRAYDRYRAWGWRKVGTLRPSWPDAPRFHALILDLPITPTD